MKRRLYCLAAAAALQSPLSLAFNLKGDAIADMHYTNGKIFDITEQDRFRWDLRRIKFSIDDDISDKLDYRLALEVNADKGELEWDDAYIRFKPVKNLRFNVGQFKIPFGLENLQSTKELPLFERSLATDIFTPGRKPGISAQYANSFLGLEAGSFFIATENELYNNGNIAVIRGRLFYGEEKNGLIHLGFGYNREAISDGKLRHEAVVIGGNVEDQLKGTKLNPDPITTQNIEFVGIFQFLSVQAELFDQHWNLDRNNTNTKPSDVSPDYSGGYVMSTVTLIGDGRAYDGGDLSPDFKSGKYLELAFRFNYVNLDYQDNQDNAQSYDIALTYYPSKTLKLAMQYQNGMLFSGDFLGPQNAIEGQAMSLRMQFMFN